MADSKARLVEAADSSNSLTFRFNPKEYTTSKSTSWTRPQHKAAKSATPPEFGGVQPQTVQMELFFDDWESPSKNLVTDLEKLFNWLKPTDKSLHQKGKPQPQILKFQWGENKSLAEFQGFLKSVSVKYTLFKPDGTPIRATANITMEEVPSEPKKLNPTSGSIAGRRVRVVAAGDSLHSIAWDEYGNASFWRALAQFNGIDDPLRVNTGVRLLIPSSDEAATLA